MAQLHPAISAQGRASSSSIDGFVIKGSGARGGDQIGALAYSDAGRLLPPAPFQGGLLCVQAPVMRSILVTSGGTAGASDGVYSIDMNAFATWLLGGEPAPYLRFPGTTITCQWWGRDAGSAVYLSDVLQYFVGP